ncbi:MAG: aminotransferase class I/II-fold pyridoxal phosphate-dependent enzyme [Treponema sp.]|jgi:aspartate/methionine/tyrosine aminotransferase|nr:aminotransferase class I/II-fold pyridoxal phosphate-dependent enzyme [Treponema sp.]
MPTISAITQTAKQSGIRAIAEQARSLDNVLHMEIGEPLFATAPHIVEAGRKALHDGYTKYLPCAGIQDLRTAIRDRINADYAVSISTDNVIVTTGGVQAIANAFRVCCDPGNEILLPDPVWPNAAMIAHACGLTSKFYLLDPAKDALPDFDELERLVTAKTKAIYINSPSNPLGVVFSETVMEKLVSFAKAHDLFLISDEVYEKLVYDCHHQSALCHDTDGRVIGIFSFSKTYAMTGWRIGYAVASQEVIATMVKMQESYVSNVPGVCQYAALAALKGPGDMLHTMVNVYSKNINTAKRLLDARGVDYFIPRGAFYIWINAECEDSTMFVLDLLNNTRVATAPGYAFGDSGRRYVRASIASDPETVREGISRTAEYIFTRRGSKPDIR